MQGIGRQTDYACRIVLHLACLDEGTRVPIAEIAAQRLLPPPFVRRIVGRLANAGILATARGMGGGIRLARPASEISLLDVVRVMEGGIVLNRCVDTPQSCPLTGTCPVHRAWGGATRLLEGHLASIRFDQLTGDLEEGVVDDGHPPRRIGPAAVSRGNR